MTASQPPSPGSVVVGVDGSPESLAALDVAVREATLRGAPLRVLHGLVVPYLQVLTGPSLPDDDLHRHANRIVADALARARNVAPDIAATGEVFAASGAQALINRSRGAALVVIGDRGLGAFTGMLIGSVAIHVAAHAMCPVLVVRGSVDPALPVLLATDGSPANDPAVGFAFEEAALRDAPLTALRVWSHPASRAPGDMQPLVYEEASVDEEEAAVLTAALARWTERSPLVDVRRVVVHGRVRKTIIEATQDAQLVVVGARGHGGFAGLLLGSVSQAVLRHASCPVAIVPHPHAH